MNLKKIKTSVMSIFANTFKFQWFLYFAMFQNGEQFAAYWSGCV